MRQHIRFVVGFVLFGPCLILAQVVTNANVGQSAIVSLEVVTRLIADRGKMTSVESDRRAKDLTGKDIQGVFVVSDVKSSFNLNLDNVIDISSTIPGGRLSYRIEDSGLMAKAEMLRIGDKVSATAALHFIGVIDSGAKNSIGGKEWIAYFTKVHFDKITAGQQGGTSK